MNVCHFHLLAVILSVFIALTTAVAPDNLWPFDLLDVPPEEQAQQQLLEGDSQTSTAGATAEETLEAIERETFREITEHELLKDQRQYTPRKCCKIGKKVADKGFYCNIDLMQVEKKNNNVYRRKMKFQGADSTAMARSYKSLLLRVEKCYPNKASRSMFSKCCEWQLQIITDLDNCKFLETREARRECKERVRAREG
ncbi:uncharacterized protein [Diadema setosum]|uniref:uncharacterized protein n=1 Tax=Diadema setosum TaxID=31175 RepID=UPI003B3A4705